MVRTDNDESDPKAAHSQPGTRRRFAEMLRSTGLLIVLLSTAWIRCPVALAVVDGALDPSFGSYPGGSVTVDVQPEFATDDFAAAVAIQLDGKIVAAGESSPHGVAAPVVGPDPYAGEPYPGGPCLGSGGPFDPCSYGGKSAAGPQQGFAVVRLDTKGALDPTFGKNGRVITRFESGPAYAHALTVQRADGKVIVAGQTSNGQTLGFAVVRYGTNGVLDASFGPARNGTLITRVPYQNAVATGVAVQWDGKVVVAGRTNGGGLPGRIAVMRYTANGVLDSSFGSGGMVSAVGSPAGGSASANAVALQPNTKIVVAGEALGNLVLVRYYPSGGLDVGFGQAGITRPLVYFTKSSGYALAIQPNGRILVAGYGLFGNTAMPIVVRYMPDGSVDESFGWMGVAAVPASVALVPSFSAMALHGDGRIVVSGTNRYNGLVAVFRPDGQLDPTFGPGGIVRTAGVVNAVALQPVAARIVAAGSLANNLTHQDFFFAGIIGLTSPLY